MSCAGRTPAQDCEGLRTKSSRFATHPCRRGRSRGVVGSHATHGAPAGLGRRATWPDSWHVVASTPISCRWSMSSLRRVAGAPLGTYTSTRPRSWRRSPARSRTACGSVGTSWPRMRSGVRAAAEGGSIKIGATVGGAGAMQSDHRGRRHLAGSSASRSRPRTRTGSATRRHTRGRCSNRASTRRAGCGTTSRSLGSTSRRARALRPFFCVTRANVSSTSRRGLVGSRASR